MAQATQIVMGITGADKTGEAFASIAKRATGAASSLRRQLKSMMGGLSVVGLAYGLKKSFEDMDHMNDSAQQMGVSAQYAQKLAGALDQVGIKGVDMDSLSAAFSKMTKETGATGAKGFEDTLAAIAAIGDEKGRVEALATTFGRSLGANLAPLVRQGPDAFRQGLEGVMAIIPATSNAAAEAGDIMSKALSNAAKTMKSAWYDALGSIAKNWEEALGMPFAEIIAIALANVKWFIDTASLGFTTLFGNIGKLITLFQEDWKAALTWVWNGVKAYLGAVFNFWVQVFKSIGSIAVSFGKEIWNAIKGDGFDWGAIADNAASELGKVGSAFKDELKALIPSSNDKLKFDIIDWDAQFAKRDELIATGRAGVQAQAKLATGTVIEDTAADAVKSIQTAVKDAAKDVSFVEAGTYAALKLQMGNRNAAAAGGAAFGSASVPGGYSSSTAQARQEGSLMQKLIQVAEEIRAGVSAFGRSVDRLEAV